MTVGRILANGIDQGSGFALATPDSRTTRVVLTAKHVVGDRQPSSLQFVTQDGQAIPVDRVEGDDDLDVAVLHLGEDVPGGLAVGHAVNGQTGRLRRSRPPTTQCWKALSLRRTVASKSRMGNMRSTRCSCT